MLLVRWLPNFWAVILGPKGSTHKVALRSDYFGHVLGQMDALGGNSFIAIMNYPMSGEMLHSKPSISLKQLTLLKHRVVLIWLFNTGAVIFVVPP